MSEDPVTAQRLRQGLPIFVALASLLLVVATMAALYLGREILVPVTLAILLSFVLVPAVRMLRRLRVPRAPAVLLVVVIVFGALFGIGSLIASEASQLASDLPRYTQVMRTKIKDLRGATAGTGTLSRIVDMVQDLSATLQPPPAAEVRGEPGSRTHPLTVELTPARASVVDTLQTFAGPILHPLATTGLILIFTIFILLQREDLRNRAIRLAGGSGDLRRTTAAIDDATSRLSRFFLAQLALNIAFGLVIGIGLWLIGVPSPTLFGVLAAILRFVPYIGAAISALLPLILAAAVDPGWSMVIATAALFLVVEPICGHVIEPLLYGHSTGLSPVAVILAATIWTFLWGPIGLVLATPLTVCLVVLGRHVERLWYLDVLLGDQPALSPPEIFYQRMLAGDPVEAIDQGWQFLKERALVTYYDEVALAGLLLAQEDLSRGTLDRERQAEVGAAIGTVVDRLGTAPVAPRPARIRPRPRHRDRGGARRRRARPAGGRHRPRARGPRAQLARRDAGPVRVEPRPVRRGGDADAEPDPRAPRAGLADPVHGGDPRRRAAAEPGRPRADLLLLPGAGEPVADPVHRPAGPGRGAGCPHPGRLLARARSGDPGAPAPGDLGGLPGDVAERGAVGGAGRLP